MAKHPARGLDAQPGLTGRDIERFRAQEPDVFVRVYDELAPQALRIARTICRSEWLAEQAVQAAFIDVWRSAPHFDPARGSLAGWVLQIVRNRSVDELRRQSSRRLHQSDDADGDLTNLPAADDLVEAVLSRERARTLHAAVSLLPIAQQTVVQLAFFEGRTHRQISAQLGLPLGTVKGRIRLAMRRLHGTLASGRAGAG